jgi:hypothetical protein
VGIKIGGYVAPAHAEVGEAEALVQGAAIDHFPARKLGLDSGLGVALGMCAGVDVACAVFMDVGSATKEPLLILRLFLSSCRPDRPSVRLVNSGVTVWGMEQRWDQERAPWRA